MPKTYTDDVAPVLPSSIDGPFQVVDPSDSASWIKIDPATARILAAGDARPLRTITSSYVRAYGTGTTVMIGPYMAARYCQENTDAGFYYAPMCIPDDMDLSLPSSVKVLMHPTFNVTTTGLKIRFRFQTTRVTQAGSLANTTVSYDWSVPDFWQANDYQIVMVDNGNGRTFDPNMFTAREIFGGRIWRNGAAAQDTLNKHVKMAELVQFEYTAKEY